MFRCYRDNENLKKHFGHMDTLNVFALLYVKQILRKFVKKYHFFLSTSSQETLTFSGKQNENYTRATQRPEVIIQII